MTGPSNPAEATNTEPVPQAARPVGTTAEPSRRAVSATGDAEFGMPAAEHQASSHAFASSADTPLDTDLTQRVPAPDPAGSEPAGPAIEEGVPDADPDEDLAAGPPDGR